MNFETLLIDDQTNIFRRFNDVLSGTGHRADRAGSSAVALKKMNNKAYDLVICHLRDPQAANSLLEEIAARFPSTRTILLSGTDRSRDADSGLVNRFLRTPVHMRVMRAAVAEQFRLASENVDNNKETKGPCQGMAMLAYGTAGQPC